MLGQVVFCFLEIRLKAGRFRFWIIMRVDILLALRVFPQTKDFWLFLTHHSNIPEALFFFNPIDFSCKSEYEGRQIICVWNVSFNQLGQSLQISSLPNFDAETFVEKFWFLGEKLENKICYLTFTYAILLPKSKTSYFKSLRIFPGIPYRCFSSLFLFICFEPSIRSFSPNISSMRF